MATVKKPIMHRYPTTPKSNSLEVLKRYAARVSEVRKLNDKKMSEYHKKLKAIQAAKKEVLTLKKKAASLKGLGYAKKK